MQIVDKIESIIDKPIQIHHTISIHWHYSNKKKVKYYGVPGIAGTKTIIERKLFDENFGESHLIITYYREKKGNAFIFGKLPKSVKADTKKEAVLLSCSRWIEWYNKTVLKKTKKHAFIHKNS